MSSHIYCNVEAYGDVDDDNDDLYFLFKFMMFVAKTGAAVANGSPVLSRHQLCIKVLVTSVILLLLGHTTDIARLYC